MQETKSIAASGLSQYSIQDQQSTPGDELGQSEFLKLMITQIKHQDPMNPAEGGEFLSQLAQFGTVNGITELQSSFDTLASSMQSSQALQASTMVGRSVLVAGNQGYLEAGNGMNGAVELPVSSADLRVFVHDTSGELVRQINMGTQPEGLTRFNWNGLGDNGAAFPPGVYQVSAQARVDGEMVDQPVLIQGKVDSVTLGRPGAESSLNLKGLSSVLLHNVHEIL